MDHPLNNNIQGPFPSPPGSPPPLSSPTTTTDNQIDIERLAIGYSEGFLLSALTSNHQNSDKDPLLLKNSIQSDQLISDLRRRRSGKRQIGLFYISQNAQIQSLLKSMDEHIEDEAQEANLNKRAIQIAIWASLTANICLAILQLYAAISSLSLSFFATALDAVFDPAANLVLYYCHKKAKSVDLRAYPSGGSKFETIGDIVYSGVMGAVSVILVAFSIQDLAKGKPEEAESLHISAIVAVSIALVTKFSLFVYCYSLKSKNSQVEVLWEDHRNDVFINAFGLFTSTAGVKIIWFFDPLGALIISVILIFVWGQTVTKHFGYLAGKAAPLEFQQLVIYKAMTFADEFIQKIDSCSVYHAGPNYIIELDVVMDPETPLWKAHDISQALQDKLEELPKVDRAYVHVDHEYLHKGEHLKKGR